MDEWLANDDRNIGNILFDGNNDFFFIDHERAIAKGLEPSVGANRNQILEAFYIQITEIEKHRRKRQVESEMLPAYSAIPFSLIADRTYASRYLADNEIVEVIEFLENRLSHLTDLFQYRIGIKQQRLAI
ncbi:MAG: hypothetical protein KBE15_07420 [Budvicia sp.]|nr:hypothetical protein [Budvicia sp.]